ncbi:integral membrane sensor signal transduction histidine kinase [Oscillochloris trichoides DG-6]|uniref:histidine kinase n=1 Tax=Oscillochloris trichoides DG-6 TaxID=765420 RepID=E1IHK8_9CHLR|nr:integral membrane sensor signal transduction histidine kinase [Oscillochloris trichoides DG-6]
MSLTLRLSLTYLLLTLVGMVLLGGGFVALAGRYLAEQRTTTLTAQTDLYAALLAELADSPATLQALAASGVGREILPSGTVVRLFDPNGTRLSGDTDLGPFPSRPALELLRPPWPLPASQVADRTYAAQAIRVGASIIGVVELSVSSAEDVRLLVSLRHLTLNVALVAALLMALVSFGVARSIARPILRQSQRASDLARSFTQDLPAAPPPQRDEIGQLGANLDTLEASLRTYSARITELEQARSRFYRSISHDLRTPLTAISGMIENLSDTAPAEQHAALSLLENETQRMARLVDELLRPPADGQLLLARRTPIALGSLLRELHDLLAGRARRAGVNLDYRVASDIRVAADRDRLKQALLNLLDNALRATPPGGHIFLALEQRGPQAILSISDDGPGIPPEMHAAIWERGVRGANPGSAGLGLAIVREIIHAHGGTVELDPTHQPGTRMQIYLPLEAT